MNWVSRLVKSQLTGLDPHTAMSIHFHTCSWAFVQYIIKPFPFILVLVWWMLLVISWIGCCFWCLECDYGHELQVKGAVWAASDLKGVRLGSKR